MASSYSYDLRTKLFKALDDGLSIVKACKIFNIGRNTIYIAKPQEIGTCYAITNNYGKHLYLLYKNENIQSSDCTYFLWSCYSITFESSCPSNSMRAAVIIGSLISALFGVAVLKYCTSKE